MGRKSNPPRALKSQLPCNVDEATRAEIQQIVDRKLGRVQNPAEATRAAVKVGLYAAKIRGHMRRLLKSADPKVAKELMPTFNKLFSLSSDLYIIPPQDNPQEQPQQELEPAGFVVWLQEMADPLPVVASIPDSLRPDVEPETVTSKSGHE